MTANQKDAVAHILINEKIQKNCFIIHEGDQASCFYIIKKGTVSIIKAGKEIKTLKAGDSFGENALYVSGKRFCSVQAKENVECLAFSRKNLIDIFGPSFQIIFFQNTIRWALNKSEVFQYLTKIQQEKIIDHMVIQNVNENEIIYEKNEIIKFFVIILEGYIGSENDEINVNSGEIFGETLILKVQTNQRCNQKLIMKQKGVIAKMRFNKLENLIGGKFQCTNSNNIYYKNNQKEIFQKNLRSHELLMTNHQIEDFLCTCKLENLIFCDNLGQGAFGSVLLVKTKKCNKYYALKCISKQLIIKNSLEKHIEVKFQQLQYILKEEKKVMKSSQFPFLMNYYNEFQDEFNLYFLIEYINGIDLLKLLQKIEVLSCYQAQFCIAQIILALEFFHSNQIIYRDLKPENIIVTSNGYLKLIDFGTAKVMNKETNYRTNTIIGSPHYMAPEIFQTTGYGYMVDLWSLGICLYEFLFGEVPFANDVDDPFTIYKIIQRNEVKFPEFFTDDIIKRLILQLLNKVPEMRLAGDTFASLKAHDFFEEFDWVQFKFDSHFLRINYIKNNWFHHLMDN